jgi:hypothetical protein
MNIRDLLTLDGLIGMDIFERPCSPALLYREE